MGQLEAALCLMLELIKHRTILNHQVGDKFERDIALQFFIPCQPDNPHSASPQNLDQSVAAKDLLAAGKLMRSRSGDTPHALVSHLAKIYIITMGSEFKARGGALCNAPRIRWLAGAEPSI